MLKTRDKEECTSEADILHTPSQFLQSLLSATTAHTFSSNSPTICNQPRWDLGSAQANRNAKSRTDRLSANWQTRQSSNSIGQHFQPVYHQSPSSLCCSSSWGYATRRIDIQTGEQDLRNCTSSFTCSIGQPSLQNPQDKGLHNILHQSPA